MVGAGAVRTHYPDRAEPRARGCRNRATGVSRSAEVGPDAAAVAEDATVGNPTLSGQIRGHGEAGYPARGLAYASCGADAARSQLTVSAPTARAGASSGLRNSRADADPGLAVSLAVAASIAAGCSSGGSRNLADEPTARPTVEARTAAPARLPVATTKPTKVVYYANCTEARQAGVTPLYRGDPGYSNKLDRDKDGVACE